MIFVVLFPFNTSAKNFNFFMFFIGLLTPEKCKKRFPTVQGLYLHLRKLMELMFASLVCTSKNMEVNAKVLIPVGSILHTSTHVISSGQGIFVHLSTMRSFLGTLIT